MSKPIVEVEFETVDKKRARAQALLDTGGFHTIIRASLLPPGAPVLPYAEPEEFRLASPAAVLRVTGATQLDIGICGKRVRENVLISPDLGREMLIGAGTMQKWDITIRNENGHTSVIVGRDMRDPEIMEID